MQRQLSAWLLVGALSVQGCATIQHPSWKKPVGKWTYIPAALCAMAGTGIGYYIQDERVGHTCLTQNGVTQCVEDDADHWKGALIGAAIGAVVCGVAGHVFLDPEPAAAAPPPPPVAEAPPPAAPAVRQRIVLRGVTFGFNQSAIGSESRAVLDEAATTLNANRSFHIVVEGHTDAIGSDEGNQALSVERAEAVYRYLVNAGVDPERMRVVGYGKTRPVADNATESGRAQNRRVELRVE
ncbi:MAG TPA: OmpA family protein [Candidatus Binatia bacterium]|nr:OmpA family protein [Candidatus Binatia bacterium]